MCYFALPNQKSDYIAMDIMSMRTFETPKGCAGWDQIHGMTESVHAELEQMFWQVAKLDVLSYCVGRTVNHSGTGDSKVQFDAHTRECQSQITFHAGRALELAMHIVYACGADRILSREYPGVEEKALKKDRKDHSLSSLYERIKMEFVDRDICSAFEEVYQEALHEGVTDVYLDGELRNSYLLDDERPFIQLNRRSTIDGAEMTLDHAGCFGSLSSGAEQIFEFEKFPFSNFSEFLMKADASYYKSESQNKRRNMRWAHYSARDHEYGRPYVMVGAKFFARLTKGVVKLSQHQWIWHPEFRQRWHKRKQYVIEKLMHTHLMQSYQKVPELPEMKTVKEMEEFSQRSRDGKRFRQPQAYKNLHKKLQLHSKTAQSKTS